MNTNAAKSDMAVSDSSFIALVFSFAGFALLEGWLVILHAGFRAHALPLLLGSLLVYMTARRARRDWNNLHANGAVAIRDQRFNTADAASAALLMTAGVALGLLILGAQTVFLAIGAACLTYAPWSRIALYRSRFIAACTMIWTGTASVLLIRHRVIDVGFLPLACWVFWAFACIGLLRRAEHLWRAERRARSGVKVLRAWPAPESLAPSLTAQENGSSHPASKTAATKSGAEPMG